MKVDEPIYDEGANEIGIESKCDAPDGIDESRYTDAVSQEMKVQFQYSIRIKDTDDDPIGDSDVKEILDSVDYDIQRNLFDDYITCQGLSSRIRRTATSNSENPLEENGLEERKTEIVLSNGENYSADEPIGVSSLKPDVLSTESDCAKKTVNQKCVIVNGGVTIYFEEEAMYSSKLKRYQILSHLKESMSDDEIGIGVENRIIGLAFTQGSNVDFGRDETPAVPSNRNYDGWLARMSSSSPLISTTGGLIIGSAVCLFFGAVGALFKKKRTRSLGYNSRDIPADLEIWDRTNDENVFDHDVGSESMDSSTYGGVGKGIRFPVMITESNSELGYEVSNSSPKTQKRTLIL